MNMVMHLKKLTLSVTYNCMP